MKTYDFETKANISEKITKSSKIVVASKVGDKDFQSKATHLYKDKEIVKRQKEYFPPDMAMVNSVLVSTNWNKNDDVFTPDEMIKAIYTPVYKPVNQNHQGREGVENTILGVILNAYSVNDSYDYYYPNLSDPEADPNFHLLCSMGIWEAYFPEATSKILKMVDENKMFVSMECFFNDFGYALKKENTEECNLLPRNEITSWLSAYLRCYDGKGEVEINGQKYVVGRWLRNINFSGVGFVENPANEKSIVFQDYVSHAKTKYKQIDDQWIKNNKSLCEKDSNGVLELVRGNFQLWQ